jgi:hypothetical protein
MPDSTITLFNSYEGVIKNMDQGYTAKAGGFIADDDVLATVTGTTTTYNAIHTHGAVNTYSGCDFSSDAMVLDDAVNLSDERLPADQQRRVLPAANSRNVLPAVKPTLMLRSVMVSPM